jgi:hypothetical protein
MALWELPDRLQYVAFDVGQVANPTYTFSEASRRFQVNNTLPHYLIVKQKEQGYFPCSFSCLCIATISTPEIVSEWQ